MAYIFQLPKQVPLSGGAVVPGAKANFYLTGTSTRTDTYSDSALSTPNANPVVADASGVFGAIYLDPDVTYKATITDADDNLIYTVDPVIDSLSQGNVGKILNPQTDAETTAGITPTNYPYDAPVVLRYGTNTTPGTTNMTTPLNNALSVVENRGTFGQGRGEVPIPFGQYKLTSGISPVTGVDLIGEGRWNTRLEFALSSAGRCVDLRGADTNNRLRSTLRKLRIDGTNCTNSAVNGVEMNWNQSQQPVLDEVTIYGGYESGGASTGLQTGLKFEDDGNNWIVSFNELGIEGCHGDQFVIDTSGGGASNAVYFRGGRIENGKARNVVVIGPDDDVNTLQVTFDSVVIEIASYQTTGVNANIHIEGAVIANLLNCYIEAGASPNYPTYEVYCPSGRLNVAGCNVAFANTAFYCGGVVTFTGLNTIRSATAGIHIPNGGKAIIHGEPVFLGNGTPITFAGTGELEWIRDRQVSKSSNYTVLTSDFGTVFDNGLAQQNITFTLPTAPKGATLEFVNRGIPVRNSTYQWTLSGSGTTEYYLELAGGGNPNLADPAKFYRAGNARTRGTVGSLADLEWDYGDNDSLGFSTIYYRDSGSDPDTFSSNSLMASYTITITPTTYRIVPEGTSGGDSIVSDGDIGTKIKLRSDGSAFWFEEGRFGTWS